MAWFRKSKEGLPTQEKRNIPEGIWTKCDSCGEVVYGKKMEELLWVCPNCDFHFRIPTQKYIDLLLDDGQLEEYDIEISSLDPLKFKDSKKYPDRIKAAQQKTGKTEGVIAGMATMGGIEISFAIMNFQFIGGSMGSVVGEKIARAIERAIEKEVPLIIVSSSGGARMQEGILSLMQMAKTSALLAILHEKKIPYISILTNPTTAGVMASYASLGDVILVEPKALLGFAGPRVIQQTIGQDLPDGFQSSEFFMDKGFVDKIVNRKDLRDTVIALLRFMWSK
ncbi:MAG: acetyl-CoA carboxylase carboxyl transferase subunit beta [Candidatus Zixiibacteriota bacterium]|nr:MAG: acetyl-CoA carboxylase carboxyl transferase subunit beta [candidate division Zixibacteria bacterium]